MLFVHLIVDDCFTMRGALRNFFRIVLVILLELSKNQQLGRPNEKSMSESLKPGNSLNNSQFCRGANNSEMAA